MVVTGINLGLNSLVNEENELIRAVESPCDATQLGSYFNERNSEYTQTPNFGRQLREQQKNLLLQEKKLREMRKSEDLQLIYEQMKNS